MQEERNARDEEDEERDDWDDERDVMDEIRRAKARPISTEPSPSAPPAPEDVSDDTDEANYTTRTPQDDSQAAVLLDPELDDEEEYFFVEDNEEELNRLSADDNAEAVLNEMSDYTEDQEILDDFAERQVMPTDEQGLMRRLRTHHSETPELSGGDIDAAWDQGEDVGDETAATEPTPDQDRVDEIGEGLGVTYEDDEELDFAEKVWKRDEERWELDLESAESEIDSEEMDEGDLDEQRNVEDLIDEESMDQDAVDEVEEDELDQYL